VAGVLPDVGESLLPGDRLDAGADQGDIVATADGHLYFDRAQIQCRFRRRPDAEPHQLPRRLASAVHRALPLTPSHRYGAWKSKPSYAVLSTEDRALSPGPAAHGCTAAPAPNRRDEGQPSAVYISQPEAVAQVIIEGPQSAQ
jgi:hypothetical protein